MISLFISLAVLFVGYILYGKAAEKVFSPDDRATPAVTVNDSADFVPLKTWKAFLVQLLNIAGTGPIFGALMGAVATLLPIDKLIGKLYPIFGILLITMAVSVICGIMFSGGKDIIPEISPQNLHPSGTPIWPYMFITVACGAVSGFHATQSPMIAKCIKSEKEGRKIFYGAMISESVIALVWAAAGVAFYGSTQLLSEALSGGASNVVYEISTGVLGVFGGILAIAGVIVCPITSGDTAFRSARLILAESFSLNQKSIKNRLLITIPLLLIGGLLTWFAIVNDNGFQVIWRYFSWSNQTLAMIALWVSTAYLMKKGKYRFGSLITAIPASFMTAVSITYILMAKEGFRINQTVSYIAGIAVAVVLFGIYLFFLFNRKR